MIYSYDVAMTGAQSQYNIMMDFGGTFTTSTTTYCPGAGFFSADANSVPYSTPAGAISTLNYHNNGPRFSIDITPSASGQYQYYVV